MITSLFLIAVIVFSSSIGTARCAFCCRSFLCFAPVVFLSSTAPRRWCRRQGLHGADETLGTDHRGGIPRPRPGRQDGIEGPQGGLGVRVAVAVVGGGVAVDAVPDADVFLAHFPQEPFRLVGPADVGPRPDHRGVNDRVWPHRGRSRRVRVSERTTVPRGIATDTATRRFQNRRDFPQPRFRLSRGGHRLRVCQCVQDRTDGHDGRSQPWLGATVPEEAFQQVLGESYAFLVIAARDRTVHENGVGGNVRFEQGRGLLLGGRRCPAIDLP
mmetsp:Transcript_7026/g.14329  ORF Transcript_7026/g.14329 Transcript_7026/m.14329 type:complete len:271 (+) Transcript_7026:2122-2934(+)